MLSVVLGLFLLVTAGLKIHGLYTDPYSQESILLTPRLLVAVIEIEILLGLWLVSGLAPCAAWFTGCGGTCPGNPAGPGCTYYTCIGGTPCAFDCECFRATNSTGKCWCTN